MIAKIESLCANIYEVFFTSAEYFNNMALCLHVYQVRENVRVIHQK